MSISESVKTTTAVDAKLKGYASRSVNFPYFEPERLTAGPLVTKSIPGVNNQSYMQMALFYDYGFNGVSSNDDFILTVPTIKSSSGIRYSDGGEVSEKNPKPVKSWSLSLPLDEGKELHKQFLDTLKSIHDRVWQLICKELPKYLKESNSLKPLFHLKTDVKTGEPVPGSRPGFYPKLVRFVDEKTGRRSLTKFYDMNGNEIPHAPKDARLTEGVEPEWFYLSNTGLEVDINIKFKHIYLGGKNLSVIHNVLAGVVKKIGGDGNAKDTIDFDRYTDEEKTTSTAEIADAISRMNTAVQVEDNADGDEEVETTTIVIPGLGGLKKPDSPPEVVDSAKPKAVPTSNRRAESLEPVPMKSITVQVHEPGAGMPETITVQKPKVALPKVAPKVTIKTPQPAPVPDLNDVLDNYPEPEDSIE